MLDVVKLFRDSDTVDELGIGSIRDGFSDLLFPGTSTLHTRAGYLIFIPWIYRQVEASEAKSRDPWKSARQLEVRLIEVLAESGDGEGTIGVQRRAALKTFPSTLYWVALGRFQLRRYRGGQAQYHRWVAQRGGRRLRAVLNDEGDAVNGDAGGWHPGPDPPPGFPNGASFKLPDEVGGYLQQRITSSARDSSGRETLLAHMLAEGIDGANCATPWEMASVASLPGHLKAWLLEAGNFSLAINGAPLLYNYMLAEKSKNPDKQEEFERRLGEWADEMRDSARIGGWDRSQFWNVVGSSPARVPLPTERFVNDWLDLALGDDPSRLIESKQAQALILERERRIKRGRARLVHPKALRLWSGNAGTGRLNFRWDYVRRIVGDILASQRVD